MSLILITGMPGVGKTTIMRHVGTELQRRAIAFDGFYTEELRSSSGERSGFDIVTFDGKRAPLARTSDSIRNAPAKNRVGKYTVCVTEFESVALPALAIRSTANLLLLDEIGKMELKSRPFEDRLQQIVDAVTAPPEGRLKFVATVPLKASLNIVERLKRTPGVQLFHVTVSNRDKMRQDILEAVVRMV
ncbi:nucleoside-triphosphatase THEP1 [Culex pipiens pallens]|uniref:nucleoside-triphosphatase THEP1 n=1 Tax=Culex pipiens pallens TaxID=42434 RepID=UPI001953FFCD|nr:nucleoside-triphosphatase THEP1 [Culex pipiens pallens]